MQGTDWMFPKIRLSCLLPAGNTPLAKTHTADRMDNDIPTERLPSRIKTQMLVTIQRTTGGKGN